jgi:hypothetical protein
MVFRAVPVSTNPLAFFSEPSDTEPHLRVADVVLRFHHNPRDLFSDFICSRLVHYSFFAAPPHPARRRYARAPRRRAQQPR